MWQRLQHYDPHRVGLTAATAMHALLLLCIALSFSHPQPPAPAVALSHALPPGPASSGSLVAGILQRSKRYPRSSLVNGEEGTARLYFVVNAQGHVIAYR